MAIQLKRFALSPQAVVGLRTRGIRLHTPVRPPCRTALALSRPNVLSTWLSRREW